MDVTSHLPVFLLNTIQTFLEFSMKIRQVTALEKERPPFRFSTATAYFDLSSTSNSALQDVLSAAEKCIGEACTALLQLRLDLNRIPNVVKRMVQKPSPSRTSEDKDKIVEIAAKCAIAVESMKAAFQHLNSKAIDLRQRLAVVIKEKERNLPHLEDPDVTVDMLREDEKKSTEAVQSLKTQLQNTKKRRENLEDEVEKRERKIRERLLPRPYPDEKLERLHLELKKEQVELDEVHLRLGMKQSNLSHIESRIATLLAYQDMKADIRRISKMVHKLHMGEKDIVATLGVWDAILEKSNNETSSFLAHLNLFLEGNLPDTVNMNESAYGFISLTFQLQALSRVYDDFVENHVKPVLQEASKINCGAVAAKESYEKDDDNRLSKAAESITQTTKDQINALDEQIRDYDFRKV